MRTENLKLGYGEKTILSKINMEVPEGQMTILIGSNGCGKSTLLKALARLKRPMSGRILYEDRDLFQMDTREVARHLSILPQNPTAPEDLTVFDIVKQGRYPHQTWRKQWSAQDERAVRQALQKTGIESIAHEKMMHLSGGQRQRAWIAMTLAQETDMIFLDEPTNHLDIKYRIEILDLLRDLNRKEGRTILMVLHDINLAARYADHLIALRGGEIFAQGRPDTIMDAHLMREVFDIHSAVFSCPVFNVPFCIPYQDKSLGETRTSEIA